MLNKGAELMLLAVLEQIEKHDPSAIVYYNAQGKLKDYVRAESKLEIRQRSALKYSRFPIAIFKRLNIPYTYFTEKFAIDNLDVVLDASGFQFSDQWDYSGERLDILENYYRELKDKGTKIILLPQAFGPFETKAGKRAVDILERYVDVIIAREEISKKYVVDAGASLDKVWKCTDFTLLVKGSFPQKYSQVRDKVCIIPNQKMVTHTAADSAKYWTFLENLIIETEKEGYQIFLLNHEGSKDLEMCNEINKRFENRFDVISDLNAKEIKGIIGASFITISSRFHGVASSLNQAIPCLATSWNHKYEMLFKDFDLKNNVLYLDSEKDVNERKVSNVLSHRSEIHKKLNDRKSVLENEVENMWEKVWTSV
jgi:colanic acid/amylovoran biosynthesis protein